MNKNDNSKQISTLNFEVWNRFAFRVKYFLQIPAKILHWKSLWSENEKNDKLKEKCSNEVNKNKWSMKIAVENEWIIIFQFLRPSLSVWTYKVIIESIACSYIACLLVQFYEFHCQAWIFILDLNDLLKYKSV